MELWEKERSYVSKRLQLSKVLIPEQPEMLTKPFLKEGGNPSTSIPNLKPASSQKPLLQEALPDHGPNLMGHSAVFLGPPSASGIKDPQTSPCQLSGGSQRITENISGGHNDWEPLLLPHEPGMGQPYPHFLVSCQICKISANKQPSQLGLEHRSTSCINTKDFFHSFKHILDFPCMKLPCKLRETTVFCLELDQLPAF